MQDETILARELYIIKVSVLAEGHSVIQGFNYQHSREDSRELNFD